MPTYEEMCAAAQTARSEWLEKRQRCWGYLMSIMNGLITHCGVPKEQIDYFKCSGLRETDGGYTLAVEDVYEVPMAAAEFNEEDGFWRVAVRILLTPRNVFPPQQVTFVLCVSEDQNSPLVKIGINEKPKHVHLGNENAVKLFCDGLAQLVILAVSHPKLAAPNAPKSYGFSVVGVHHE